MKYIITVAAALGIAVAATGCSCGYTEIESDGVRILTVTRDHYSFSVEYSTFYQRKGPNYITDGRAIPSISIDLAAPQKTMPLLYPVNEDELETVTVTYTPAVIGIHIYAPHDSPNFSQSAIERLENDISDSSKWENFELLERYPVTVSGVEGELIAYVIDWFLPFAEGEGPKLQYHRAVYFDYNGLIWTIEATTEMEMVDQVKADFEHIIETFEILE
jgi:hypothetical protein